MQPERRKRFRIMTLKNLGYALIAALVVLAAANVISEMRPARHGEFGRLELSERQQAVTPKYRPMVVHEGEVPDVTPSGGAVALNVEEAPGTAPSFALLPEPAREPAGRIAGATLSTATGRSRVTITGGADGVRVETTSTNAAPKLSGGIFRQ